MHKIFKEQENDRDIVRIYKMTEPFSSYYEIKNSKEYFLYFRRSPSKEYVMVENLNIRIKSLNLL